MPYDQNNQPDRIKALPDEAKTIWISAFNNAYDNYSKDKDEQYDDKQTLAQNKEAYANRIAWVAVGKAGYKKESDEVGAKWVKSSEVFMEINLDNLTVQKANALHNKLHSEYVDARFGPKTKPEIEKDHQKLVSAMGKLGMKHAMRDKLDETLPMTMQKMSIQANDLPVLNDITLSEDGKTSRVQILRVGAWDHPSYGHFNVEDNDLATFKENFDKQIRRQDIAVDFEHFSDDPGGAAGWVKDLEIKNHALYALIEWTKRGMAALKDKLFRYFSPEFDFEYSDPETGMEYKDVLIGGALTNRPFIKDMEPVVLSENIKLKTKWEEVKSDKKNIQALPKDIRDNAKEVLNLNEGVKMDKEELLKKQQENPDSLSDEEKKFLEENKEEPKKEEPKEEPMEEEKKEEEQPKESAELSEKVAKLTEENKKLREMAEKGVAADKELKKMKMSEKIDGLAKEGKILPKQKDKMIEFALGLSEEQSKKFDEIMSESEKVISFSEKGFGGESGSMNASETFNKKAKELSEKDKISLSAAMKKVAKDEPELYKQASEEMENK